MKRYVLISGTEAAKRELPDSDIFEPEDPYDEQGSAIYRCDDEGNPVELIGTDGGEPEDNTFRRDWSWVLHALNAEAERHDT